MIDRRAQGGGVTSLEQLIAGYADAKESCRTFVWERRVIAVSAEVAASIASYNGHLRDEGGPLAFAYGSVNVVREGLSSGPRPSTLMTRRRSSPGTRSWSPRPTPVRLAPGVDPRHPWSA